MNQHAEIAFESIGRSVLKAHGGCLALFADSEGRLTPSARPVDRMCGGAVARCAQSPAFKKLKLGRALRIGFPAGVAAEAILLLKLDRKAEPEDIRRAGASISGMAAAETLIVCQGIPKPEEAAFGAMLRSYRFGKHKSGAGRESGHGRLVFVTGRVEVVRARFETLAAVAEGVLMTRDLVNEPANVLTTGEFARRLKTLEPLGVEVTILEEKQLESLGMRALLAVGQGSANPSRVGILRWRGGDGKKPLLLVGKGVVFDSGGISLKPAAKMEQMTMDMAGAAVVTGVMRAVAQRRARADVIGIVGLVENMPGSSAQRPGDVVRSLKGDTVEVINTDAEGRLVLADILWHGQSEFSPSAIIDLATLTGAIIVSLGKECAGAFSNDEKFCRRFLSAAAGEGERAWMMPLHDSFDRMLKSRIADMKNVGGRDAGAITAAQFLQRFVKPEIPWIHLDIAGVSLSDRDTELAPAGATGWGVRAVCRLIREHFENRG